MSLKLNLFLKGQKIFVQNPLWSKKHSPNTICNTNKHLKPSQIAANKWNPQPLRPSNAAKALGFAHVGPVRILKMRTAEGVPRGTPIGDFFGSFLARARNERMISLHLGPSRTPVPTINRGNLRKKWTYYSQTEMSVYPICILDRWTCEATSRCRSLQGYGLIGIYDRRTCKATSRRRSLQLWG